MGFTAEMLKFLFAKIKKWAKEKMRACKGLRINNAKGMHLEKTFAEFLTVPPAEQNAFDLFAHSWSTLFDGVKTAGTYHGLQDPRIAWLLEHVDMQDKSVLELGPLEGAHTYLLEKAGANVLAIEANKGAFLRSLIAKNHLNFSAKILLGDFEQFEFGEKNFDLVVASGVLYHMKEPTELLKKLCLCSEKIFLWTHYFEPDTAKWHQNLLPQLQKGKWDYANPIVKNVDGFAVRMVKQFYAESLDWTGFCGGTATYSQWIFKDDLLGLLKHLGFTTIKTSFDSVDHQNGPSFCILCEK